MTARVELIADEVFADGFLVARLVDEAQPSAQTAFARALAGDKFSRAYARERDPDR